MSGAVLDHPQRGCYCPEHEKKRAAAREWWRQAKDAGARRGPKTPGNRPALTVLAAALPSLEINERIQQFIAVGLDGDAIIAKTGYTAAQVEAVWAYMEALA